MRLAADGKQSSGAGCAGSGQKTISSKKSKRIQPAENGWRIKFAMAFLADTFARVME
jgi:hypothetical protein